MGGLGPCDPDLGSRVAVVSLVSLATLFSTELQEGDSCASHLPDLCGCLITSVREQLPLSYSDLQRWGLVRKAKTTPLCLLTFLVLPLSFRTSLLAARQSWGGSSYVGVSGAEVREEMAQEGKVWSCVSCAFIAPQSSGDGVSWAVPRTDEEIYSLN